VGQQQPNIKVTFGFVSHKDLQHEDEDNDINYTYRHNLYGLGPHCEGYTVSTRQVYLSVRPTYWVQRKRHHDEPIDYQLDQQMFINYKV
jgi:hypothetical protein